MRTWVHIPRTHVRNARDRLHSRISQLERQRQVDPWALLARHLVDLVTFGPVRDAASKHKGYGTG